MQMICSNFLFIFFLLTFVTVAPSKSVRREGREEVDHKCDSDHDCPTGYFCYKISYLCASCLKCEKYHRLKSNIHECSTIPRQCGDCIPGYHAPKDTDGLPMEVCRPDDTTTISRPADTNTPDDTNTISRADESLSIKYTLLGVSGLILFMIFVWVVHKLKRQMKAVNGDRSERTRFCAPSAPPPPYPDSPSPSSHNNGVSIVSSTSAFNSPTLLEKKNPFPSELENSIHGDHVERAVEKKLQAVPFYDYITHNSSELEETDSPAENENLVDPNIHDDTTQPSSWRPEEEPNGEDVQTENESLANTSNEEVRHFSVISAGADSPVSTQSAESSVENNITSDENGNEQRSKKRRTHSPESNTVSIFNNFNLCILNTNGHINENVMFCERPNPTE